MFGFALDLRCMSIEAEILRTPCSRFSLSITILLAAFAYMRTLEYFNKFSMFTCCQWRHRPLSFGDLVILSRILI